MASNDSSYVAFMHDELERYINLFSIRKTDDEIRKLLHADENFEYIIDFVCGLYSIFIAQCHASGLSVQTVNRYRQLKSVSAELELYFSQIDDRVKFQMIEFIKNELHCYIDTEQQRGSFEHQLAYGFSLFKQEFIHEHDLRVGFCNRLKKLLMNNGRIDNNEWLFTDANLSHLDIQFMIDHGSVIYKLIDVVCEYTIITDIVEQLIREYIQETGADESIIDQIVLFVKKLSTTVMVLTRRRVATIFKKSLDDDVDYCVAMMKLLRYNGVN